MKQFASPGIDSVQEEQGVFNSGAGFDPTADSAKTGVHDWSSRNPVWGTETGRLIGNDSLTQAPPASSIRIRRRGVSPWGGFFPGVKRRPMFDEGSVDSRLNVGGSVDHNAGASATIAGGKGAASSFVRIQGARKSNEGQKLPVLPSSAMRGEKLNTPTGGMHGTITAPMVPKVHGMPSIIKVVEV